uniref:Uncharacterized protein n=1 Tax=Arundo donax TaxID=35708 RepID=A0A0A8YXX6_ARUDO
MEQNTPFLHESNPWERNWPVRGEIHRARRRNTTLMT